jgi:hypothetical protein
MEVTNTLEPRIAPTRRFGVEHELFLRLREGGLPTLENRNELFRCLANRLNGRILRESVAIPFHTGVCIVKNDFCTHILEIEFPPCQDLLLFHQLFQELCTKIFEVATSCGFQRMPGAYLASLPGEIHYAPPSNPSAEQRMRRLIHKPLYGGPFAVDRFNARMASTQIHVELDCMLTYSSLRRLYSYEYFVPLFFSNSTTNIPHPARCVRPLLWRDAFSAETACVGFPNEIPQEYDSYCRLLARNSDYRDYSLICPRTYGTFEFRTGCSQPDYQSVTDLILFRLIQCALPTKEDRAWELERAYFYALCQVGEIDKPLLFSDLDQISCRMSTLPKGLQALSNGLLTRLHRKPF